MNQKFEIIGEAARHLSAEAKEEFPDVPGKLLTAMRNILILDYDDVDLNIVWETTQRYIPSLIAVLKTYLATTGQLIAIESAAYGRMRTR